MTKLEIEKMTFKDLRKAIYGNQQQHDMQQPSPFSSRVHAKPFWTWNVGEHKAADIMTSGQCCFNHIIGLPAKNGVDQPFFDYERIIFYTLKQHKHVWIKKATGLGTTKLSILLSS